MSDNGLRAWYLRYVAALNAHELDRMRKWIELTDIV